jgi:proteasome accessory factor A
MQMIVAMLEAGVVNPVLALDNPLETLRRWSRDPTLTARARLVNGRSRTAVEVQIGFLEAAKRFASDGGFDGIVPEAKRLLMLWEDTLVKLAARDFKTLSRRLDWVAKYRMVTNVLDRHTKLTWQSPLLKQLDQLYANIDDTVGPFWALERDGHIDRVVSDAVVEQAGREPPADTRAWTRAHLLRLAGTQVEQVDWDRVQIRGKGAQPWFASSRVVYLPVPFGSTRAMNGRHFIEGAPLESVVQALQAVDRPPDPATVSSMTPFPGGHS